jgi:hypothetical protein
MNDKLLFRLALCFSILGLIALFFISEINSNVVYDLEEGDLVKVKGKVENLKEVPDGIMFDLVNGNEKLKVISSSLELRNGMKVYVEGEVKDNFIYATLIKT